MNDYLRVVKRRWQAQQISPAGCNQSLSPRELAALSRTSSSLTKMFSNLPQKITVPFNLLGDEAKLAFRSKPTGIAKLATTRVSGTQSHLTYRSPCSPEHFGERLLLGSSKLLLLNGSIP